MITARVRIAVSNVHFLAFLNTIIILVINAKNITRLLGEKNQVLTIPYNTLLFEASNEAGVPDLFLRLKRISDIDDRNAIFMQEVKRATENIIYRLQELQAII